MVPRPKYLAPPDRHRLSIEPLEARIAPATFVVLNLNDSGVGSLREAIDQANAAGGLDTITFQAGLHGTILLTSGSLAITDELTIKGPGGNKIILNANQASRIFDINDGTATDRPVTLSGLAMINGNSINDADFGGGAIFSAESLTLKNCVITGNVAAAGGNGGGVAVGGAELPAKVEIIDCTIANNLCAFNGGGVFLRTTSSMEIVGSKIINNYSPGRGGGAFLYCGNNPVGVTISSSVLTGNKTAHGGGGLYLYGLNNAAKTEIQSCTISGNTAGDGGGIYARVPSSIDVEKTNIVNNFAEAFGGGISVFGASSFTMKMSKVTGNRLTTLTTATSSGGGIYLDHGISAAISNSEISGNSITGVKNGYGGGIAAFNGVALTISKTQISNNYAYAGGGIFTNAATGQPAGSTSISGSTISGNWASEKGGGIFIKTGPTTLKSTKFVDNSAEFAGGGALILSFNTFTASGSTFSGNVINLGGGGGLDLLGATDYSISGCHFIGNQAESSGGGAIVDGQSGAISSSQFIGNVATSSAAGLANEGSPASLTFGHSSFSGNIAQSSPNAANVNGVTEPVSNPHGPAGAFTVTNLLDDGSVGSLRSVIEAANNQPGPHTIVFQAGLAGAIELNGLEIPISGPLTVKGPGASEIVIDAGLHSRVFNVNDGVAATDSPVVISGLTFERGLSTSDGGVILSAESLTLKQCVILEGSAENNGGAVAVDALKTPGSTAKIIDSEIAFSDATNSSHSSYGGGLALFVDKSVTISGSRIIANHGDYGGGAYAVVGNDGAGITISGTTFSRNSAEFGGGMLVGDPNTAAASKVEAVSSTFRQNVASNGGGGIFAGKGNFLIEKTSLLDNSAANAGGGFFGKAFNSLNVVTSTVSGNLVTTDQRGTFNTGSGGEGGAGLYVSAPGVSAPVTISSSKINGNTSAGIGGGMTAAFNVNVKVTNSDVEDNVSGGGGGICLSIPMTGGPSLTVTGGEISENVVLDGEQGGGILTFGAPGHGTIVLEHVEIVGNSATQGAGVQAALASSVKIVDSTISGNIATIAEVGADFFSYGGGLDLGDGPNTTASTISGSIISGNFALEGGGVSLTGGTAVFTHSKIINNVAASDGGAFLEQLNPTVTIDGTDVIAGNLAATNAN